MTLITQPRFEVAGLPCVNKGHGRPMLLLHGVGLQADVWSPQIMHLSQKYRVIAPDMPGHGAHPPPQKSMDIYAYADAMLEVLDSLSEPAMVIGHSMGAQIAVEWASQRPSKVCSVVALNAVFEREYKATMAVRARAAKLDGRSVFDPGPTLNRWFGKTVSPERTSCEAWLCNVDPKGYKLAYSAFANANGPHRDTLAALNCPALFMTGADEPNSTPAMSKAMASLAPRGRALIIENAAHMMPMTHPSQVNAALLELAAEVWS